MKTIGKFFALLALGLVGTANAANVTIVITGSTAMRTATHDSILNDLNANGSGTLTYGFTGASLASASQAIFKRQYGADNVIIKTVWTGSVDGIRALAQAGVTVSVLADGVTTTASPGTSGLAAGVIAATADVAIADNLPSSTIFVPPTYTALTATPIAIIPFKWLTNNGSPALNVTPQLVRALYGIGDVPLHMFTGNPADNTKTVNAYGRNPASGTRVIQLSETGFGVKNPVSQYEANTFSGDGVVGGSPDTIESQSFTASSTVLGVVVDVGDNGYSSGGTLADTFRRASGAGIGSTDTILLAPMGLDDANRCLASPGTTFNGPGTECTYNGVAYSLNNVKNGSYTFWSNAQLLYKASLVTGTVKTIADRVATNVKTVTAPIKFSDMLVERAADGGTVTLK